MAKLMEKVAAKTKRQKKERLSREERENLLVKRCPECFINLPIDARECFSCHTRIRGIDKFGRAKKSGEWISYVICVLAWVVFIAYIKWAFF